MVVRAASRTDAFGEKAGIDGARRRHQAVAGRRRQDHLRSSSPPGRRIFRQRVPQPGDVRLDGLDSASRRRIAPEGIDERVNGHHLAVACHQRRQQPSRNRSAQFNRPTAHPDPQRPEDADAHAGIVGRQLQAVTPSDRLKLNRRPQRTDSARHVGQPAEVVDDDARDVTAPAQRPWQCPSLAAVVGGQLHVVREQCLEPGKPGRPLLGVASGGGRAVN
jgi:hypothetical protein